jgi:hypothetical protein
MYTMKTDGGSRGIDPLIPNLGTKWGWVFDFTPGRFTPGKNLGTHWIGGWVGPRASLGGFGEKILPLSEFEPRTAQLAACRYTD